jgi:hypothetical protein
MSLIKPNARGSGSSIGGSSNIRELVSNGHNFFKKTCLNKNKANWFSLMLGPDS